MAPFLRGSLPWLGRAALAFLLLALCAEAALQIASRFTQGRASEWRPGAAVRILCVGDSHTFGVGVPEGRSYPAWLQRFLDEGDPGRYSVINLGIPGLRTGQVRERLPLQVARYHPDVVIVWAGVNDAWNIRDPESDSADLAQRLEAFAVGNSRLYRLVRVALHDRGLERAAEPTLADGRHQLYAVEKCRGDNCEAQAIWRVRHGGVVDMVENRPGPEKDRAGQEHRARVDLRAIHDWLKGAGIALVLVKYPLGGGPFGPANRAVASLSRERGVPAVDAAAALQRIPREQRRWLHANHPDSATYREIARDAAAILERLSASG